MLQSLIMLEPIHLNRAESIRFPAVPQHRH
jgi:hypothetical protein